MSDFTARRLKQRWQQFLEDERQLQTDVAHWNRIHPESEPIVIPPITREEIERAKAAKP